jgi:hypothetical protein
MLGQFPLQPNRGGRGVRWARIVLRLRSADRAPANPFQRLLSVTAHKRLVVLSSRVSSVQNSPDRQTRRAGGIYQDRLGMLHEGSMYMRNYWF